LVTLPPVSGLYVVPSSPVPVYALNLTWTRRLPRDKNVSGEGLRALRGCPAAPSTLSIMFLDIISLRKVSAGVMSLAQSSLKGVEGLGVPMGIFVMIYGLSILENGLSTGPLVAASLFVLEGLSAIIAYIALAREVARRLTPR